MRILILEDEPIIAFDLEDIVLETVDAEVVHASTVEEALATAKAGLDFAMLDFNLADDATSLPVAELLRRRRVPFCFISSNLNRVPGRFATVPKVCKPFRPDDVAELLPLAA